MIKFPGWLQGNNEGPPDLDQVMRDLSRKINTENAIEMATRKNLPDLVDYYLRNTDPYDIDFNASLFIFISLF